MFYTFCLIKIFQILRYVWIPFRIVIYRTKYIWPCSLKILIDNLIPKSGLFNLIENKRKSRPNSFLKIKFDSGTNEVFVVETFYFSPPSSYSMLYVIKYERLHVRSIYIMTIANTFAKKIAPKNIIHRIPCFLFER